MSTMVTIKNLGQHGRRSKAPAELGGFLTELFRATFGKTVHLKVIVENRRLEARGHEVVRPLRIQDKALVIRCWPTDNMSIGGRVCHVRFSEEGLADKALEILRELVEIQGLNRNNYQVFLRDGQLRTSLDEFWTEERLDKLTGSLMAKLSARRSKFVDGDFGAALNKIIGSDATNIVLLEKHIQWLKKHKWLELNNFGNSKRISNVRPGRAMQRHVAVSFGAIDPDDYSEETLEKYIETNEILNGELSAAIGRFRSANKDLPKAIKLVERLTNELVAAEIELERLTGESASAEADIRTVYELKAEVNPIYKVILEESGIQLPIAV